ncbi:hypothetical protein [Roseibium algae]|uniref:Uncharacterized protein n=1 Tax=Roseibium algae TaxID=3123038 RepID=A0ABU8TGH5_9HYPH
MADMHKTKSARRPEPVAFAVDVREAQSMLAQSLRENDYQKLSADDFAEARRVAFE